MNQQNLILVVDDNSNNLKVLTDVLRTAGHRVLVANSGESALEKLQQVSPNLILLDVMMPGIDGFETCRRLKAAETACDIPVIFTTALTDAVDRVKGLELGAVDYITKPIQHDEVLARVNVHLKLYNLTQELEQRVTERTAALQTALDQLKKSQIQLVQSEKLSALGQMMAGVAHEINNPIGFIAGNLSPAQDYAQDLLDLLDLYQKNFPQPGSEIEERIAEIDLPYLRDDFLKLIASMQEGVHRVRDISNSLRNFSRVDGDRSCCFDLREGVDSSLMILRHRLKATGDRPAITVLKAYGELTNVECYPGQLNQVFINLLSNAVDALEETIETKKTTNSPFEPTIQIHTQVVGSDRVAITITDNGLGMSEQTRSKLFEPFFTTKPVGRGTGLGLSISYQIITEKHGGVLSCDSVPGQGTKFVIELPICQPPLVGATAVTLSERL
jgi:two-component system NtrC family sensor kinase